MLFLRPSSSLSLCLWRPLSPPLCGAARQLFAYFEENCLHFVLGINFPGFFAYAFLLVLRVLFLFNFLLSLASLLCSLHHSMLCISVHSCARQSSIQAFSISHFPFPVASPCVLSGVYLYLCVFEAVVLCISCIIYGFILVYLFIYLRPVKSDQKLLPAQGRK